MRWLEEPVFRPPAEAGSLIFQAARGCPHNRCLFCGMYKGVPYVPSERSQLFKHIDTAAKGYPETRRIFLADGDAMALPFSLLEETLERLNAKFPLLARVSSYANGSSLMAKTDSELERLKSLKLSTAYVGLESGDEELLRLVRKGETAETMVEAVRRSQGAGIKASVMVLAGLGGASLTERHAEATAKALNKMRPRLLSALRFIEIPGLKMFEGYRTLSEHGSALELKRIIEGLDLDGTVFRANHSSIPFPLEGRLSRDRDKLAGQLDRLINSYILDREGPGRIPLSL